MKYTQLTFSIIILFASLSLISCKKESDEGKINDVDTLSPIDIPDGPLIADHLVAKEAVLRSIPITYINTARNRLHIAYQHTSHGTHVSYGMFGLQDYKSGDDVTFGITNNNPGENKLDFRDNVIARYAAVGESASDLSSDERAFIQASRNFLDDPDNKDVNVIMWSWCNIANHDVAGTYLPGMKTLISEYGIGGSKIGTESGQRMNAVHFILMTGHANASANVGEGLPKNQADLIIKFCNDNKQFCLDYYNIDTHDMEDTYYEDAGDDGNSLDYDGNFYIDWQNTGTAGQHYYENKTAPGGDVAFGAHNSQHITANRKAYAMWWILARLGGWDGSS